NDPTCAVIVHSIVDLGHSLGLTIVAEGVETAAILTDLRAVGCDVAQGYYLSRPVPAVEFDYWLCYRPELDQSTRMTGPLPPAALSLLRTPGLVNLGGSQDLETQK
ncbi:MAG: EAL domain-containing protein, partial [Actinomycetota bacterium]